MASTYDSGLPQDMADNLGELLDSLPGVIIKGHYTTEGPKVFLYVSQGAKEIFGVSREQLKADSQLFWAICHPDDRDDLKASISKAVTEKSDWVHSWRVCNICQTGPTGIDGQPYIDEQPHINGQPARWIRVSSRHFRSLPDGSAIRVSSFLDITREKRLEEGLRLASHNAEQANKAKSTFLANISHEMRTPLNGILGYAQLLSHQLQLTGQAAKNLKSLSQCGNHLLAVINDVLDMARIESGLLNLQSNPIALEQLFSDVNSVIEPLASAHGLDFTMSCSSDLPPSILSDDTRLRQILINLLNNAVKFTESGKVSLAVSIVNDQLQCIVTDTGCGIPANRIDTIFKPFERLDVHHSTEGTGLGLAITSHIVECLNGTLTLESEPGKGSRFTILLPYEEVAITEGEAFGCTAFELKPLDLHPPPRILVVDDRKSNRDVLKQTLELYGFAAMGAENGIEALRLLRQRPFDLLLSDIRMPVMGGLELIGEMKQDKNLKDIPCIAISASIFPGQIQQVLEAGFHRFLPKPCSQQQLFTCLCDTLNLKRQAHNPEQQEQSEPATLNAQQPPDMSASAPLPSDTLNRLKAQIDIGDIDGLRSVLAQELSSPEHASLKNILESFLDALDLEGFTKFLSGIPEIA